MKLLEFLDPKLTWRFLVVLILLFGIASLMLPRGTASP
jgi:hypothetical protein